MTKYVLNSGGINNNIQSGKKFFSEVLNGFGETPKVLICLFAIPREDWEKVFEDTKNNKKFLPENVFPSFELASPETFEQQLKRCDVVYMSGGDDHLLQYWFKQFDLPEAWEGKTVATNSASSNVLAKHFWTCDWRRIMDGFGILPIKFIAHFKSEYGNDDPRGPINWDRAYEKLSEYGDTALPIHALKEGEYVVIEK